MMCTILAYHVFEEPRPKVERKMTIDLGVVKWEKEFRSAQPEPELQQWLSPYTMRLVSVYVSGLAIITAVVSWILREGFWLGFLGYVFAVAAVA